MGAGGVSLTEALSLSERNQIALYVAIGEYKGGFWDYDTMEWDEFPPPVAVMAIPASIKGAE